MRDGIGTLLWYHRDARWYWNVPIVLSRDAMVPEYSFGAIAPRDGLKKLRRSYRGSRLSFWQSFFPIATRDREKRARLRLSRSAIAILSVGWAYRVSRRVVFSRLLSYHNIYNNVERGRACAAFIAAE